MKRKEIKDYETFHSDDIDGIGEKNVSYVLSHVIALRPKSIINYGAGRSMSADQLAKKTGAKHFAKFDPAAPGIDVLPKEKFDLVVSFDVLEHIPEDEPDAVLSEMKQIGRDALHVIDIAPAKAILSDGKNAHVSLMMKNGGKKG